jgi:tRNA/rRNA methyltransferase
MTAFQDRFCVVLVAPRNPLNIGAAARAMSNFGLPRLRLVNPYNVAYQEAKSAVNAAAVLEASREYATLAEAVADCSLVVGTTAVGHRELQHPLRRLEVGGRLIREHLPAADP